MKGLLCLPFLIFNLFLAQKGIAQFTEINQSSPLLTKTQFIDFEDVDGDGDLDAAIAGLDESLIYFNDGTGDFSSSNTLGISSNIRGIGFLDVFGTGSRTKVVTSTGSQIFVSVASSQANIFSQSKPSGIGILLTTSVADLNNDGKDDILSTSTSNVALFVNTSASNVVSFSPGLLSNNVVTGKALLSQDIRFVEPADFDGDGDLDLVVASLLGNNLILECTSVSPLSYNAYEYESLGLDTRRIQVADMDNDGNLDVVQANFGSSTNEINYYNGGALSNGLNSFSGVNYATAVRQVRDVELIDFDFDGLVDIIESTESGEVNVYRNEGNRSFTLLQTLTLSSGQTIFDVKVADLNADKALDLYVGQSLANGVTESDRVFLGSIFPYEFKSISVTGVSCNGDTDGAIVADVTGGEVGYEYSLDGINFTSNGPGINTSISLGNLSPGNYTLTVRDNVGDEISQNFDISEPDALSLAMNFTDVICFGDANGTVSALALGGTTPYEYSLNGGTFMSPTLGNLITFTGVSPGAQMVEVMDANGCTKNSQVFLYEPPELLITGTTVTNLNCYQGGDGTVTLSFSGGTPIYEYSFDGTDYEFLGSNSSPAVISNVDAGTQTLYLRDINGCEVTTSVTLSEPPVFDFTYNTVDATCSDLTDGAITSISASGGNGGPFEFSLDGVSFQTTNEFTGLGTGDYNVTVKDASGCTVVKQITIGPDPIEIPSPSIQNTSGCDLSDGQLDVSASGGTSPYMYSIDGGVAQSSSVFSGLTEGNYTTNITDANGCTFSDSFTIDDPTLGSFSLNAASTICANETTSIEVINDSGGSGPFQYSIDGTNFVTSNLFVGLDAGTYTIIVQESNNCEQSLSVTISEYPEIIVATTQADLTCFGSDDGTISVQASGGNGGFEYSTDGTNFQTSIDFTGLAAGSYTITVKDQIGCEETASVTLNEPDASLAPVVTDNYSTTFGTVLTGGWSFAFDAMDNVSSHFYIDNIQGSGLELSGSGAITGSIFITPTDLSTLEFHPSATGSISFDVQSSNGSSTNDCLSGSPITITIDVDPAPLQITAGDESRVYGTSNPSLTFTYSGFVNGEDASVLSDAVDISTVATSGSDIGTYAIVTSGATAPNYDITFVDGTLTVAKADLTLTPDDQQITYGQVAQLSGNITGVVNSDDITAEFSTLASATSNIGNYDISASAVDPHGKLSNYNVTSNTGTLTIAKASLTATANDQRISFGDAIQTLDGTITGILNGDDIIASYVTTAMVGSDVGTYSITVSLNDPDTKIGNYDITLIGGTLTIDKSDQTISFSSISNIDLESVNEVTLVATSDAGLPVTYSLDQGDGSISGNTLTVNATGNFTVTASQAGTNNYHAATDVSQSFLATDSRKDDQTITFTDDLSTLTYGDSPVTLSASATSMLEISYTTSGPVVVSEGAMTITGAGEASVTAIQSGNDDFNPATTITIDFTIAKATLTAMANDETMIFGTELPTFIINLSGFVGDDTALIIDAAPTASTTATSSSAVNTYPIVVTGGSDDNYGFTLVDGKLTIVKAPQTIQFDAISDVDINTMTTVTLAAIASSGLPVTYELEVGEGSINANVLTVSATGNFKVNAIQPGNENYEGAPAAPQSFLVTNSSKTDQTIIFTEIADQPYGEVVTLSGSSSSSLTVTYELVNGNGTIEGSDLTIQGVGEFEVVANQSGDETFNPAPSVKQIFQVSKVSLTARAKDVEIMLGDDLPDFEIEYTGFKLNETEAVLDELPTAGVDMTIGDLPGEYDIMVLGGSDNHYELVLEEGTLTIQTVLSGDLGLDETTKVYPNPATENFVFEWTREGPVMVRILDISGGIQWEGGSNEGMMEVDISNWAIGLYHVQLFDRGQLLDTRKLFIK